MGVEGADGVVDVAVGGFVELVGGESGFAGGVVVLAGEEGGAEEGGFGVEVLGGTGAVGLARASAGWGWWRASGGLQAVGGEVRGCGGGVGARR